MCVDGEGERAGETVEDEDGSGVEGENGLREEGHGLDEVGHLCETWMKEGRSGSSGSSLSPRGDDGGCRRRRTLPGRSHGGGPPRREQEGRNWRETLVVRR